MKKKNIIKRLREENEALTRHLNEVYPVATDAHFNAAKDFFAPYKELEPEDLAKSYVPRVILDELWTRETEPLARLKLIKYTFGLRLVQAKTVYDITKARKEQEERLMKLSADWLADTQGLKT